MAYPAYDARIGRDFAYAVRVTQGGEIRRLVVYNHCEKSALANRTHGGDVNRRFCEFAFDGGPDRVDVEVKIFSNEKKYVQKFSVANNGAWHRLGAEVDLDFDLAATDMVAVFLRTTVPCDELLFRDLSLVPQI